MDRSGKSRISPPSTKSRGDAAEDLALDHLQKKGLTLLLRNYRVARGPRARGGEIDLVLRESDGTLVFVEVRSRSGLSHGGAAASITHAKRERLRYAARCFLMRLPEPPPCRFDVVTVEGHQLSWIRAAFDG